MRIQIVAECKYQTLQLEHNYLLGRNSKRALSRLTKLHGECWRIFFIFSPWIFSLLSSQIFSAQTRSPQEYLIAFFVLQRGMLLVAAGVLLAARVGRADKGPSPDQSYGAPAQQQAPYAPTVKYGGPIVYSGEKPPIIHFPPPPEVHR